MIVCFMCRSTPRSATRALRVDSLRGVLGSERKKCRKLTVYGTKRLYRTHVIFILMYPHWYARLRNLANGAGIVIQFSSCKSRFRRAINCPTTNGCWQRTKKHLTEFANFCYNYINSVLKGVGCQLVGN